MVFVLGLTRGHRRIQQPVRDLTISMIPEGAEAPARYNRSRACSTRMFRNPPWSSIASLIPSHA